MRHEQHRTNRGALSGSPAASRADTARPVRRQGLSRVPCGVQPLQTRSLAPTDQRSAILRHRLGCFLRLGTPPRYVGTMPQLSQSTRFFTQPRQPSQFAMIFGSRAVARPRAPSLKCYWAAHLNRFYQTSCEVHTSFFRGRPRASRRTSCSRHRTLQEGLSFRRRSRREKGSFSRSHISGFSIPFLAKAAFDPHSFA